MPTNSVPGNGKTAVQQKWAATFYWIGIAMSVLCVATASARNTELLGRFEHGSFPLSWAAGLIAIAAFLASEYFHPAAPAKKRAERRFPTELPESLPWETEFADR
jgi:hypothetical protein